MDIMDRQENSEFYGKRRGSKKWIKSKGEKEGVEVWRETIGGKWRGFRDKLLERGGRKRKEGCRVNMIRRRKKRAF